MKNWLVILLLLPIVGFSQSKKKRLKAKQLQEQKANETFLATLQKHISILASDSFEGRRTGTKGELLAMNYIVNEYTQAGISPKGNNGYVQEFEINEGKFLPETNLLLINEMPLKVNEDYFPLAYSINKTVEGKQAMVLKEKGEPWFLDVKDELENNKNNPHFDVDDFLKKQANECFVKGATALIVYNSTATTDNILFNKNDKTEITKIPIVYITADAAKKFLADKTATYEIKLTTAIEEKKRLARNVVAYIDNNAVNTVIVGAHYDHLGFGEDKNALDALHEVHNGADDNASGTAALMELEKMLQQSSAKNNNYLIIHFSGEELGLFGSKYWLENPSLNINANYMLNMDMVGRYDTAHKLTIGGYGTSPLWGDVFADSSLTKNLLCKFDSTGSGPSDHASFYRANIPVLFFFTGSHSDYHKTTDDWDKINYAGEKQIIELINKIIEKVNDKDKLVFTKTAEPKVGKTKFSVSLGVIPDYGFTGTGVRIEGIPAEDLVGGNKGFRRFFHELTRIKARHELTRIRPRRPNHQSLNDPMLQ